MMPDENSAALLDTLLERLYALYPKAVDLSLDRLRRLLRDLGAPQHLLPPVIHVAGTNGKGSTCAFIRAIAEQAGLCVHAYTSPHLVRFNERYLVTGELASDEMLLASLRHIEQVNAGQPITAFEAITAAAFDLFARHAADLSIIEVGLGGRFDATNVVENPACCAITAISLDHAEFLGTDLAGIAREKAGIIKPGRPVVTGAQTQDVMAAIQHAAQAQDARLLARGTSWRIDHTEHAVRYEDDDGVLNLPLPGLAGMHQIDNAGIAIATLRQCARDGVVRLSDAAFTGIAAPQWPARMQHLHGALAHSVPAHELWLDGGHNPGAASVLQNFLQDWRDRPLYLVVGMKQAKDLQNFLQPLAGADALFAVAEPGQFQAVCVDDIVAASGGVAQIGPDVAGALRQIRSLPPGRVLICGSLYLAGEVLKYDLATDDPA